MASFNSVAINYVLTNPRQFWITFNINNFSLNTGSTYENVISFEIKNNVSGPIDILTDPNLEINSITPNFTDITVTPNPLYFSQPIQLTLTNWNVTTNIASFEIQNLEPIPISNSNTSFTIFLYPTDNIPFPSSGGYYVYATIETLGSKTSTATAFCLYKDTTVLTPYGFKHVNELKQNDYVITHDYRHSKIQRIYRSLHLPSPEFLPWKIPRGFFYENYPPNDCHLSRAHCVWVNGKWFAPFQHPEKLTQLELKKYIEYYHIELENYPTDNLVINGGCIVESLGNDGKNKERDWKVSIERTKPENSYFIPNLNIQPIVNEKKLEEKTKKICNKLNIKNQQKIKRI